MALAKGHSLKTKSQVSDIRTIGPLVYIWLCLDNASRCIDYPVESCKITVFLYGSIFPNLKGH